jgi:hypothetical protein
VTAIDDTDYRIAVSSIIQDTTLTSIQKNTAQAELFGWTESLRLYLVESTDTPEAADPDDLESQVSTTKTTEPDLFTVVLRTIGIAASPLSADDGPPAWSNYLHTYMSNYQGSYTYK